ncbi:La ribonucleoprotein domain member 1 [Xenoophorus captivus]|uniref:La ribonucleoprotein domain member 1 n=1 Tax=Xenoophorus captivus TaxID=1517983 RepID=A0ABV0RDS9_9TELE
MKIRRKEDPEKWPLPGLMVPNHAHTDFSQLINCPEFVPRQMTEGLRGRVSDTDHWPNDLCISASAAGSSRSSTPVQQHTKTEADTSNLKTMPKGLSASLPDLDSESWIEVKKRPRPSPARPKVGNVLSSRNVCSLHLVPFSSVLNTR